ncbi:MAG: sensor histidine kinase [Oscillospiraceae bacterium]
MRKSQCILLILIILFGLGLSGCAESAGNDTSAGASRGTLDLTKWDFGNDGMISLDGQWEFYWDKFLFYDDLMTATPDLYAEIPSSWTKYTLNGIKLPSEGYATYRLHVISDLPEGTQLGLYIGNFSSAYNLYVDGDLIESTGHVADNAADEIGEFRSQDVYFSLPASEFDIVIQTSNYHYGLSGFWSAAFLGNSADISGLYDSNVIKTALLYGALLIIAAFYLAMSFLHRGQKYTFYFFLLCIFSLFFADGLEFNLLPRLLPWLNIDRVIFLCYSSYIWGAFFLAAFFHSLFESRVSHIVCRIILITSICWQLFFIITSPLFFSKVINSGAFPVGLLNFNFFAVLLCSIVITAAGLKNNKTDGLLNLLCIFIFLATFLYDSMFYANKFDSALGATFYIAIYMVLLIQMFIQAKRIKEYHEAKTNAELKFLQAQIKPHFLYNSMNTFISTSRYDPDKARELMADFSEYLRKSFDFKGTGQLVPLKDEIRLTQAYLNIEQARFEERIKVSFGQPENQEIMVPSCMLQPVVENAVIHGILPKPEGGRIDIRVENRGGSLRFSVKDDGVGISTPELSHITENETSGVGLANISQRLRVLYGKKLNIQSEVGKGTEVSWEIPLKARKRRKSN